MNLDPLTPLETPDRGGHAHVADLDACLDLINSEELTDGLPEEHMATLDDAVTYFEDHELAHEDALRRHAARDGARWLTRVHDARAALREVWDAQVDGRRPTRTALDALNRLLENRPLPAVDPAPHGVAVGHRHSATDPTGEALARVVAPLLDGIAAGDASRFRICANDGCRWAFTDRSRGGRRRWCDMSSCGNRAKAQRYRSRRRTAGASEAGSPADESAERGPG